MSYADQPNIFSPDGRLIQVEYAHHASEQGSLITACCSTNIITLCIEKKHTSELLIHQSKLFQLTPKIYFSYSGISADAQLIKIKLLQFIHSFKLTNDIEVDFYSVVNELGRIKQRFTIEGGKRPFGVRSILFGLEELRMFIVEPDGNFGEYKQCSLGYKYDSVQFKEYNLESKVPGLADEDYSSFVKTIKAMQDTIKLDEKKVEVFVLKRENVIEVLETEVGIVMKEIE